MAGPAGRLAASQSQHRLASLCLAAALSLLPLGCGATAPAPDGPAAVVGTALERTAARDLEGLRGLACAGQEDRVRDLLGLAGGAGAELLPGLDLQEVLDAVRVDVSGVRLGEASVEGDVAHVPVTGSLRVTFDAATMRPLLRRLLEAQGVPMTDDQLDALLGTLEAHGQEVPLDERVRLVREGGAWRICPEVRPGAS